MKKSTYSGKFLLALPLTVALWSGFSTSASAQPTPMSSNPSPAGCPGMMGSGSDMMGGYGMGPGMMGGGGMGMMGGAYGAGHGMMAGFRSLNLSDEQRTKIDRIGDETRKKNWELMGRIHEDSNALRDLYYADKPDPAAIGKAYQKIFDLKRQMIETSVEAHNRMEAVLTKEQRDQLKRTRPRGGMMWQEP